MGVAFAIVIIPTYIVLWVIALWLLIVEYARYDGLSLADRSSVGGVLLGYLFVNISPFILGGLLSLASWVEDFTRVLILCTYALLSPFIIKFVCKIKVFIIGSLWGYLLYPVTYQVIDNYFK
jgi:hypothetical protein